MFGCKAAPQVSVKQVMLLKVTPLRALVSTHFAMHLRSSLTIAIQPESAAAGSTKGAALRWAEGAATLWKSCQRTRLQAHRTRLERVNTAKFTRIHQLMVL